MKPTIVIGGGYWGEKYIQALGNNCIAVVDRNLDRLAYLKNTWCTVEAGLDIIKILEETNVVG